MWRDELLKEVISLLIGGAFGGFFTYKWNLRQKRRELQLFAVQQFYVAYGEFFAVWKLWNRLECIPEDRDARKWELHKRAASAEAIIEGTLVKLSSELRLTPDQIEDLGCFRQAFQALRESIREDEKLPWWDSDVPEYLTFKTLAVRISALIAGEWKGSGPSARRAAIQLLEITSNRFEGNWVQLDPRA